jgi:hypothetical protein
MASMNAEPAMPKISVTSFMINVSTNASDGVIRVMTEFSCSIGRAWEAL